MAFCEKCGTKIEDGVKFCSNCGNTVGAPSEPVQPQAEEKKNDLSDKVASLNNTADTTEEFDAADIEKNKLMAVLAYIIFLIPLLAAKDSPFAKYHTNQGLVLFLAAIASGVILVIPILGWIIAPIASILITVLAVIGIINALNGKAKELPIIGKFKIIK